MYLNNHFEFDWGMVASLDPEYAKKYLCTKHEYNLQIQEKNKDMQEIIMSDMIDVTTDTTAWEREIRGTNRNNYSEEELAIIQRVLSTNKSEPAPKKKVEEGALIDGAYVEDTFPELVSGGKVSPSKREIWQRMNVAEREILQDYTLKLEYQDYPSVPTNGYIALPPPTCMLKAGTHYTFRPNTVKILECVEHSEYLPYSLIVENYAGITETDDKIIIYTHKHLKNRYTNAFKRIGNDRGFEELIFNKKTGTLYHIAKVKVGEKKKKYGVRYKYIVRQYTMALINFIPMQSHVFFNQLFNKIVKLVRAKVPDAIIALKFDRHTCPVSVSNIIIPQDFLDSIQMGPTLFGLILQYKLGKRVPWLLDAEFLSNLNEARKTMVKDKPFTNGFMGYLRKNMSTKNLLKKFYKKDFENIFVKLWSKQNMALFIGDLLLRVKDKDIDWYNEVKYYLSITVNRDYERYTTEIMRLFKDTVNTDNDQQILRRQYARLYLKHIYNMGFPTHGHNQHISHNQNIMEWHTFRDTLDMARENYLGRVRMSHIRTIEDLWDLHLNLITIQNRNSKVLRDLSQYTFLPFKLPDKEYDGFKFVQLMRVSELVEEGTTMKHCVGSYGYRCLEGSSIIVSMRKERSWVTIELNGNDYQICQQYSIGDNNIRNGAFLDIINKWHKDVMDLHKNETAELNYELSALINYKHQQEVIKQQLINSTEFTNTFEEVQYA